MHRAFKDSSANRPDLMTPCPVKSFLDGAKVLQSFGFAKVVNDIPMTRTASRVSGLAMTTFGTHKIHLGSFRVSIIYHIQSR